MNHSHAYAAICAVSRMAWGRKKMPAPPEGVHPRRWCAMLSNVWHNGPPEGSKIPEWGKNWWK